MPKAVVQQFGGVAVIIEPTSSEITSLQVPKRGRNKVGLTYTAAAGPATHLKKVIAGITTELGAELRKLSQAVTPSEIQVEISVGFSQETSVWVMTSKGEGTAKLILKWTRDDGDKKSSR
jgi:hypothetical protein